MLVVSATSHSPRRRLPLSLTCYSPDQTRRRALRSPSQRSVWRTPVGMWTRVGGRWDRDEIFLAS